MAARVCSECGGLVASSLSVCPHCGFVIGRADGVRDDPHDNYTYANQNTQSRCFTPNPHNNIMWPILSLFFFWPCAIGSLIYYIKSDQAWNAGNAQLARHYGESSNRWGRASLWIVVISIVLFIVFFCSMFSLYL